MKIVISSQKAIEARRTSVELILFQSPQELFTMRQKRQLRTFEVSKMVACSRGKFIANKPKQQLMKLLQASPEIPASAPCVAAAEACKRIKV